MLTLRRIVATLRRWLSRDRAERELHDEVESYVELRTEELRAEGVPGDEARRRACIELGGVAQVEEAVRQSRTGALVEQTLQDTRYALRGLRRTPGFVVTAVLTLGLGIGVNTAIFSVVNAALLKPVPYDHSEELVDLGHLVHRGTRDATTQFGLSWDEVEFWRAEQGTFAGVEAFQGRASPIKIGHSDAVAQVGRISSGLPGLLGTSPLTGRMFTAAEAAADVPVALISEPFWRQAFGARRDIVGQSLDLEGGALTIVGVLPREFRFGPGDGGTTQVFRPLVPSNGSGFVSPVFRLRRGASLASAEPLADAAAQRRQQTKPEREPWHVELAPFDAGRTRSALALGSPLKLLLAIAIVVLLIACAWDPRRPAVENC